MTPRDITHNSVTIVSCKWKFKKKGESLSPSPVFARLMVIIT